MNPYFSDAIIDDHTQNHCGSEKHFHTDACQWNKDKHLHSLNGHTQHQCKTANHPFPVCTDIPAPDQQSHGRKR